MCGGRVIYVQGRSDHGRISRDFWQNRPENLSRASAFAEGTHPDRGFASVFVTAPDGLRLHIRSYGSSVASALPDGVVAAEAPDEYPAVSFDHRLGTGEQLPTRTLSEFAVVP